MISCGEDKYDTSDSPLLTYIKDIKLHIGDTVIVGKINENNKEIYFPKLDKDFDLSAVKFTAILPQGAEFEYETYDFTPVESETQTKQVVAVVNGIRKREYFVTIRLSMPVFGADFSATKLKVYDYSKTGGNVYPDLSAALTRCADMDETYILIPSRDTRGLHLLKVDDVKQGNINSPIALDITGVSGGTFAVSAGRLAQGHIYVCNLATATQDLKIYHWATPTSAPDVIFSQLVSTIPGYVAGRIGDGMSIHLDENGDGNIFLGVNPNTTGGVSNILKIQITGFTTVATSFLSMATYGGLWLTYSKVDDVDNEYTYTGYQAPVMLVSGSGVELLKMTSTVTFPVQGADTRVINYNQERYLALISATSGTESTAMYIYNITRGATTQEALELLEAGNKTPIYKFSFSAVSTGSAVASIGVAKDDDALYIFGASPGAGFAVFEAPKASEDDDFDDFVED
jgi:hypothetical protein